MGLVGSKDEAGKMVLGGLPPGFLDRKGRDLRDKLDECLGQNMWYFTAAGMLIALPASLKYKTEKPLFAAAIACPFADMLYGTARCEGEKTEFVQHYKHLQEQFSKRASDLPEWEREQQQQQQQREEKPR